MWKKQPEIRERSFDRGVMYDELSKKEIKACHLDTENAVPILSNEPFAIFGSRAPHFIALRTSGAYNRYVKGQHRSYDSTRSTSSSSSGSDEQDTSSEAMYSDDDETSLSTLEGHFIHSDDSTKPSSLSLDTDIPFAVIWDPETGFSTFSSSGEDDETDGSDHSHWSWNDPRLSFTSNDTATTIGARRHREDLVSDARQQVYLPQPAFKGHRAMPSSMLEGPKDSVHFSCFDPLSQESQLEPDFYPPPFKKLPLDDERSIDDEGFFESLHKDLHFHPDCDPHLPSRFSMTTSSTSRYVEVDFDSTETCATHSPPNLPYYEQFSTRPRPALKALPRVASHVLSLAHSSQHDTSPSAYSKPSYIQRHTLSPRLSRALKGRCTKRPQDERWVFVEVKSVVQVQVTERMLDVSE
ncbi:hypothetical protein BDQ12DRAFT_665798 [Crucibulum laeve]|uniref:Uncharacterized protein n=1 Tax=Crucibulum laeve TaxID=68775 RepID=A0A5C3M2J2_9AGAR|nr:hypothetical protein BDQ12DRAFT_665798 [Crucibulum laeve]